MAISVVQAPTDLPTYRLTDMGVPQAPRSWTGHRLALLPARSWRGSRAGTLRTWGAGNLTWPVACYQ